MTPNALKSQEDDFQLLLGPQVSHTLSVASSSSRSPMPALTPSSSCETYGAV